MTHPNDLPEEHRTRVAAMALDFIDQASVYMTPAQALAFVFGAAKISRPDQTEELVRALYACIFRSGLPAETMAKCASQVQIANMKAGADYAAR